MRDGTSVAADTRACIVRFVELLGATDLSAILQPSGSYASVRVPDRFFTRWQSWFMIFTATSGRNGIVPDRESDQRKSCAANLGQSQEMNSRPSGHDAGGRARLGCSRRSSSRNPALGMAKCKFAAPLTNFRTALLKDLGFSAGLQSLGPTERAILLFDRAIDDANQRDRQWVPRLGHSFEGRSRARF